MSHNKFSIIILFFLVFYNTLFAQSEVEILFGDKYYDAVIDTLSKKDEYSELNAREYFMLARSYGRTKQYANGLVYAKKMQDLCLEKNDTTNLVKALNLALENFVDLGEIENGLRYNEKVNVFFREKDSVEYQKYCFKLGMLYYHNGNYEKAYETYNKITKPEYRRLNLFYHNYALTLLGVGKWDEAILYLEKSLEVSYSSGVKQSINKSLSNIAMAYIGMEDWEKSKIYLDSAANSITAQSDLISKKKVFQHYFDFYRKQGLLEEASNALNNIELINQDIFQQRLNEKLNALETSNKREYTLKKKVKLVDGKLVASQKQTIWIIVVFSIVSIGLLSFIFLYKYRNIKAAHENLVTEQRLLRAQMNPHFIFNSLSVLQGMILNREDGKAIRYVSKFSKLLRLILESSRKKMVPINEELKAIQNYIDLQNMGRQVPFKYDLTIDEVIENEELLIPPMLIQPFVENAIEHGFKAYVEHPEICIVITFKDEKLHCEIKDNGVGIDTAVKEVSKKNKNSLATKITSERLKMISKEYKVESNVIIEDRKQNNEQGTRVLLTLPHKTEEHA